MSEKVIKLRENVAVPVGGLNKLVVAAKAWNARRLAKAELRAMPAHLLNDIGVRRELIDDYVDGLISRRSASVVELDRPTVVPAIGEAKAA